MTKNYILGLTIFFVLIFYLVFIAIKLDKEQRLACESKCGYYYKAYKSQSICLKNKDVLQ